jgi:hypothetical protein
MLMPMPNMHADVGTAMPPGYACENLCMPPGYMPMPNIFYFHCL